MRAFRVCDLLRCSHFPCGLLLLALRCAPAHAQENFDYIAEHLPEVAMDNRLATLPLWSARPFVQPEWRFVVQASYSQTTSQSITLSGGLLAAAAERVFNNDWSVRGMVFADSARFSGDGGVNELAPTFVATALPLALPASARFGQVSGTMTQRGSAIATNKAVNRGWLAGSVWTLGVVWQRQVLAEYRVDYVLLDGADAGAAGSVDYSASYAFFTPYLGMQWRIARGAWLATPRWLFAIPLPQRGLVGTIDGPGFSASGDSATAGNGKFVGDQFFGVGCALSHLPSGVTIDLGITVAQYLLEPITHGGVDRNIVLSIGVDF